MITQVIFPELLAISSRRFLTPQGWRAGFLSLQNGRFLDWHLIAPKNARILNFHNHVILPGIVDAHVHINEPGRSHWEGFATASQAAVAGGICTLADMPLNCIPATTSYLALKSKEQAVSGKLWADCAFHGGVIPGNLDEIPKMAAAGIKTFKAFMCPSGVDEFPFCTLDDLDRAMPVLSRLGLTLLLHAEIEGPHSLIRNPASYTQYEASRPKEWEIEAISKAILLAKKHDCKIHIVHLSTAAALPEIRRARSSGVRITVETCPHYLLLDSESIPNGDATFKCSPPIREKKNADALWQGLISGDIDMIVSDHSPCAPALKHLASRNLADAWGGIASLQFSLPLIWTEMQKRQISQPLILKWMCQGPAKLIGQHRRKGQLAPGYDADFVVLDDSQGVPLLASQIRYRHPLSPYLGRIVRAQVKATYLRATAVFEAGKISQPARGQILC